MFCVQGLSINGNALVVVQRVTTPKQTRHVARRSRGTWTVFLLADPSSYYLFSNTALCCSNHHKMWLSDAQSAFIYT